MGKTLGTYVEQSDLPSLVEAGQITSSNYAKALGRLRNPSFWNSWAMKALFALAVGHILAGIIFFFAFNWNDISANHKFILVEGGIIACVIAWLSFKLDSAPAQAFGIAATVLIGISLAIFAQVYQTPAAIYTPFILWATLSLPFALASRSLAHWTVWLAIFVFAIGSYIETDVRVIDGRTDAIFANIIVMASFSGLVVLYDQWASKRFDWANAQWFRLILILISLGFGIIAITEATFGHSERILATLPILGMIALISYLYRYAPSVAALSLTATGLAIGLTEVGLRSIADIKDISAFLVAFIWMIGLMIGLGKCFQYFIKTFSAPKDHRTENGKPHDKDADRAHKNAPGTFRQKTNVTAFANALGLDVEKTKASIELTHSKPALPGYMQGILAFAGLLAAIFALGFMALILGVSFKIDNKYAYLSLGAIVWTGSVLARRQSTHIFTNYFLNTLILAGGALGLFAVGILLFDRYLLGFYLIGIGLSLVTIVSVRDRILEFICTFGGIALFVSMLMTEYISYPILISTVLFSMCGLICLTRPLNKRLYDAAGTAFMIALPILAIGRAFSIFYFWSGTDPLAMTTSQIWVTKITCSLVVIFGVFYLNKASRSPSQGGFLPPIGVLIPLVLATLIMPLGGASALLIILTGYSLGLRGLAGIGIAFEIYFLYRLYYDLSATLLEKSILLVAAGTIYLLIWIWLRRSQGEIRIGASA